MCRCLSMYAHLSGSGFKMRSGLLYPVHAPHSILVLVEAYLRGAGMIWWSWPLVVCWCSTAWAHLPVIGADNRIWFTVSSLRCCTHHSDQRNILVLLAGALSGFFLVPARLPKGVFVKYKRETLISLTCLKGRL